MVLKKIRMVIDNWGQYLVFLDLWRRRKKIKHFTILLAIYSLRSVDFLIWILCIIVYYLQSYIINNLWVKLLKKNYALYESWQIIKRHRRNEKKTRIFKKKLKVTSQHNKQFFNDKHKSLQQFFSITVWECFSWHVYLIIFCIY